VSRVANLICRGRHTPRVALRHAADPIRTSLACRIGRAACRAPQMRRSVYPANAGRGCVCTEVRAAWSAGRASTTGRPSPSTGTRRRWRRPIPWIISRRTVC